MLSPNLIKQNLHDMIQWDLQYANIDTTIILNLNIHERIQSVELMKENIKQSGEFEYCDIKEKNLGECFYKFFYDQNKTRIIGIVRVYVESAMRCVLKYYFTMMIPIENVNAQLKELETRIEKIVFSYF